MKSSDNSEQESKNFGFDLEESEKLRDQLAEQQERLRALEARNHTLNEDLAVFADQLKKKEKESEAKDTRMMQLDLQAQYSEDATAENNRLVTQLEQKAKALENENKELKKMVDVKQVELDNIKVNNILIRKGTMSMGRMSTVQMHVNDDEEKRDLRT